MSYKRLLPHAAAVIIFYLVTAIFFAPLFNGRQVRQGDIEQFKGSSKEIQDFRAKTGAEPLWTNSMFSGMPAYQISTYYPNNLVQYVQRFFAALMPSPAPIVFLGMIGFYLLLQLGFSMNPWLSIAGSAAYGLSSYTIVILQAGHNTQAQAVAYMAPVLMGVLLTFRGRLFLGGALTALALALEIFANHLQVTYYLLFILLFVAAGEAVRLVRAGNLRYLLRAAGVLAIAAMIAVLPNLTNLYLTNEYGNASTRGKSDITIDNSAQTKTNGLPIEYATQWSYGKGETFTLLIPDFNGGASEPIASYNKHALDDVEPGYKDYIGQGQAAYFGGQPVTGGPVYVGAIVCFLFILGLFIVKDSIKWWLLGVTALSILLAWGHNFRGLTEFFFFHVPGYDKFRAVYMILVIAQLTMPVLAMLTIKELVTNAKTIRANMRPVYFAFALTGGIALLVFLAPDAFVTPGNGQDVARITRDVERQHGDKQVVGELVANLETARLAIVKSDAGRSFVFILLAAGLIFFYVRRPFSFPVFAGAIGLLLLADMWSVAHRYMSDEHYEKKRTAASITPSAADALVLQDTSPDYRVLNLATDVWQDGLTSYFHKSIGGYHGAKLKRMQELYEQAMSGQIRAVGLALQSGAKDPVLRQTLAQQSTLNMLNTKYIIYNPEGGVLTNPSACGNAWFVRDVKMVADADEEIKAVSGFSPERTALVDRKFEPQLSGFIPKYDSAAGIQLLSYAPNDLRYESNAASEQLAVFSEVYYDKGWNAYVDGKPVEHFRADFLLRAMRVPAGRHQVEFKFEPSFYYTGEKIALAGSLLLFAFVGAGVWLDRRRNAPKAAGAA